MNHPEVSVVIPAYNLEKWLGDAVGSVLAQTFQNWELLIVNDGSTDNTLALAHSYNDPRIRVIDQANAGVSAARNAGIAAAKGTYVTFLDADDVMLPNCLEARVQSMKSNPTDWMYCDIALTDEHLKPSGEVWVGVDSDVLRTLLFQRKRAVPGAGSNVMAHRRCFEQGALFDEHLSTAADQDFAIQLSRRFSSHRLPGTYNLYRILPGSMSKNVALYEHDVLRMFNKAVQDGLLDDRKFRNKCLSNVYWAIGGSWWLVAKRPFKAIPFLLYAIMLWPGVVIRPVRRRMPGMQ